MQIYVVQYIDLAYVSLIAYMYICYIYICNVSISKQYFYVNLTSSIGRKAIFNGGCEVYMRRPYVS